MKRITRILSICTIGLGFLPGVWAQTNVSTTTPYDIVLTNGRVIDPETKLDAVRNVGIKDGKIAAVSPAALRGQVVVDATGLIVAPGFIDWHAHGQNTLADRVQAFDGVTTALELEAGMLPIGRWYDLQARSKRVVNYGASSSWGIARITTLEDTPLPADAFRAGALCRLRPEEMAERHRDSRAGGPIVNLTEQGLKEGGLGIGIVPGYAPGSGYKELLAVHTLAAKYQGANHHSCPLFWRCRSSECCASVW